MFHNIIKQIHKHRILFLLFFSMAFMFMLGLNPVSIGRFIGSQFGLAVGMSVGVPDNPMNKLALELRNKEIDLEKKEKDLTEREDLFYETNSRQDILLFVMGLGIWVLFCLILINFYLDYKKKKALDLAAVKTIRIGRENLKTEGL